MLNTDHSQIRIALAGHTGVGKTTLISTLRKAYSGVISPMGNTTKEAEDYKIPEYQSLQATFVDCPGFQNASEMLHYIKAKTKEESVLENLFKHWEEEKIDVKYDRRAVDALENSDVVLYIADVRRPADDSDLNEVKVIQKIQPQVVAVLNKAVEFEISHNKKDRNERIEQWREFLNTVVKDIIVFDAHWDKPGKVQEIYNAILKVLPLERKKIFETGLRNFSDQQRQIERKAYRLLIKEIIDVKNKTLKQKIDYGAEEKAKKELKEDIENLLKISVARFLEEAIELYKIEVKNPNLSVSKFLEGLTASQEEPNEKQKIQKATARASKIGFVGSLVGLVGGSAGAIIGSIISGGFAIPLIIATVTTVGGIGGVAGAVGGMVDGYTSAEGDTVFEVKLSSLGVSEYLAEICLTIIYALSHHGYGAGQEINLNKFNRLLKEVQELNKNKKRDINWNDAKEVDIIEWCEDTLRKLEN
jgi:GTPase Era involved in 16S rRNA processing